MIKAREKVGARKKLRQEKKVEVDRMH